MPKIEEQIEISAARADVFRFCHDMTKWSEWAEEVMYVELLTPKPLRAGTLLRIDAQQGHGAIFSWEAEFVNYQMPMGSILQAIDTAPSSPFGVGSQLSWQLESGNGVTQMTWIWDYKPGGFIASIKDVLGGKSSTHKAIKRSLVNLKTLLESGRRATLG